MNEHLKAQLINFTQVMKLFENANKGYNLKVCYLDSNHKALCIQWVEKHGQTYKRIDGYLKLTEPLAVGHFASCNLFLRQITASSFTKTSLTDFQDQLENLFPPSSNSDKIN